MRKRQEYQNPVMTLDDFLSRSTVVDEYDTIITSLRASDDYKSIASASTDHGSLGAYSYAGESMDYGEFEDLRKDDEISSFDAESPTNSNRPRSTFVRFALDEKGQPLVNIHTFKQYSRSEKRNIWYQTRDFASFKKKVQSKLGSSSMDFVEMYGDVRKACRSSNPHNTEHSEVTRKWPVKIAESKYRGIEPFLYKETMTDRQTIIQEVLKEQSYWKALGEVVTPDDRAKAIGDQSRSLTKSSRRLAHLLGSGDAAVARRIAGPLRFESTDGGLMEI